MEGVWLTHVEIHFVSSLAWEEFGQHMYRYTLCTHWHGWCLVNTSRVAFCVLAGMGGAWSTQVEIHFVSSLEWDRFGQHKLRYIFGVLAGIGEILSTHVEMKFLCSLTCDGFGQHKLRYILCPRCHGMSFVNTS